MAGDMAGFVAAVGTVGCDMPGLVRPAGALVSDRRGLPVSPWFDGPQWVACQAFPSSAYAGPVFYGRGVCIVVCSTVNGTIYRSTDLGATWTQVYTGYNVELKTACSDGHGRWLITCGNAGISNNYLYSYDDGLTWTLAVAPTGDFWYGSGADSLGVFLMATYGSSTIYRSKDLVNWVGTSSPVAGHWRIFLGDGNGKMVGASDDGTQLIRSLDCGMTWQTGAPTADLNGTAISGFPGRLAYGNGILVCPRLSTSVINYSYDFGLTWKQAKPPAVSTTILTVLFMNGLFYAMSHGGNYIWVSSDAVEWRALRNVPTVVTGYGIAARGTIVTGYSAGTQMTYANVP